MAILKIKDENGNVIPITSIRGEKGEDGLTPFINDKGNWQIGDEDTGVSAQGGVTGDITQINNTFANALKSTVMGSAVGMNDMSPIEHDLKVKLKSKNILPFPYEDIGKTKMGIAYTNGENGTVNMSGATVYTDDPYFSLFKGILTKGTYTFSSDFSNIVCSDTDYMGQFYFNGSPISSAPNPTMSYTFTLSSDSEIEISYLPATSEGTTFSGYFTAQLEMGSVSSNYTPFIEDFGSLTISKYGKNLLDWSELAYGNTTTYFIDLYLASGTYTFNSNFHKSIDENVKYGVFLCEGTSLSYQNALVNIRNLAGTSFRDNFTISKNGNYRLLFRITGTTTITQLYDYLTDGNKMAQVSVGTKILPIVPYVEPTQIPVKDDGTVEGLKSTIDSITLLCKNNEVVIECEYNKDIIKAFEELQQAIISLGGNV